MSSAFRGRFNKYIVEAPNQPTGKLERKFRDQLAVTTSLLTLVLGGLLLSNCGGDTHETTGQEGLSFSIGGNLYTVGELAVSGSIPTLVDLPCCHDEIKN
jgi:hypothetical protein